MNLLQETLTILKDNGHTFNDVFYIGSGSGNYSCTWSEFLKLADHDYTNSYGAQKVANDLIIVFNNGSIMSRKEINGAEKWEYTPLLKLSEEDDTRKISSLFVSENKIGWVSLDDINGK